MPKKVRRDRGKSLIKAGKTTKQVRRIANKLGLKFDGNQHLGDCDCMSCRPWTY